MPRDKDAAQGRRDLIRERIAHVAARIMAEDGIEDFGLAKRKAARQAGIADSRSLPNNEEIERALRTYQQLYQEARQTRRVDAMRRTALQLMRELDRFNPHLTGSVLSGVAGKYAGISLQLFTDDAKEVEFFLLNRGVRYRTGEIRLHVNDVEKSVPSFSFDYAGADASIIVLSARDQRYPVRLSAGGRAVDRAPLAAVEALVNG